MQRTGMILYPWGGAGYQGLLHGQYRRNVIFSDQGRVTVFGKVIEFVDIVLLLSVLYCPQTLSDPMELRLFERSSASDCSAASILDLLLFCCRFFFFSLRKSSPSSSSHLIFQVILASSASALYRLKFWILLGIFMVSKEFHMVKRVL